MANPEHLEILKQGVEKWNQWRKENKFQRPLIREDLSGADLRGANLRGANLRGADLRGVDLWQVDLRGADLSEADFRETDLCGADLRGANLSRADLSRANLRAHLSGADLSEANLSGADLIYTDLTSADLRWAILSRAVLCRADLRWAILRGAILDGADLSKANLRGAILNGADLREAVLNGADLSMANFRDAILRWADLRNAILNWAVLIRADLSAAILIGADLSKAILSEGGLSGAILCEADLSETHPYSTPKASPIPPTRPAMYFPFPDRTDIPAKLSLDLVQCSVYSPPQATVDSHIMVQVFIHFPEDLLEANRLARSFDGDSKLRGVDTLSSKISRGVQLAMHLVIPGLYVEEPVQIVEWYGSPESVQFDVYTFPNQRLGNVIGTVRVLLDSLPIGHIKFLLKVVADEPDERDKKIQRTEDKFQSYKSAFVSYANEDQVEVMKRVQMLKALKISFFQDVLDLEPGERWRRSLYKHIDESDVFLLFWSSAAKRSKWVMEEARYALNRKGGDDLVPPDIIPVILEGPPPPTPPPELAHIHFNDYLIYFISRP